MKSHFEKISSQWPPPHNPTERTRIGRIDEWEVRVFPQNDTQHPYFKQNGFLHLQLWHPTWMLSVLTPSRLTDNFYEIFPFQKGKLQICCLTNVNTILQHHLEAPGIDPPVLQLMERYVLYIGSLQRIINQPTAIPHF